MRKKKIILAVILCLSALVMVGCGGKETSSNQTNAQQEDAQEQAEEFFANGDYEKARELFKSAGNQEMVSECTYLIAKNCLNQKDYASAVSELEKIPDYKDVKDLLQNARYEYGIFLYDKSQFAQAIEQLEQTAAYKETEKYLDKCQMELKYDKFDYNSFSTLGDDSAATMTNKEIRDYMEECMNSMYSSWYRHDQNNESVVIDKYCMDGKEYGISSWGGQGNYTEFDIYYMDGTEDKIHISLSPDFAYMDVADEAPMILSIGDTLYYNYTSDQAEEYAALREEEKSADSYYASTEYYFPGYAYSNSLGAYVYYAYVAFDKEQQMNVIRVECTIGNTGSSDIQFVASNYFSLDYNGVITSARSTQYDYTTLAPGGEFTTELIFNCPSAKRIGDTFNMKMIMENSVIHLSPAPQTEEEQLKFPGVYMSSSPSYDFLYIVTDTGNGTYEIISIDDFWGVSAYQGITLSKKNKFEMGAGDFRWRPNHYDIQSYDYDEEAWGEPYIKKNPLK